MNNLERRLFRYFVEGGGDITDDRALELMARAVQTTIALMPTGTRTALELALGAPEGTAYRDLALALSTRVGRAVTVPAFRQRVARGMQELRCVLTMLSSEPPRDRIGVRPE